ncbi:MAG: 50S ribosomal protein L1 [Candidatus Lindowbacteria bacterium]|nr:50S ribosomal protein L1 [Candidatus Lindowbacteria bacterium]
MKQGKRSKALAEKVAQLRGDRELLPLQDAISIVKETVSTKFDESIELAFRLGIDSTQSDQNVRGTVMLPKGTGKTIRIAVFASGEKQKEAEEAGADFVGSDDLAQKVQGGWTDFDLAIATPDQMRNVGKLGKILGPKGIMPNPKSGTVTMDIKKAVEDFKSGRVEYRNDKSGNVHLAVGKASFESADLVENATTAVIAILRAQPSGAKGTYLRSMTVSSTMGVGIKVDTADLRGLGKSG